MAAEEGKDKKHSNKPITDAQRFKYIGFEVFPGKPKDLFKTDAEKKKYVGNVLSKRESGEVIRDECTLLEERVSFFDRLILTLASVIVLAALFIPWYSVYNEVVEETQAAPAEQVATVADSGMVAEGDSLMAATATDSTTGEVAATVAANVTGTQTTNEAAGEVAPQPGVIKEGAAEEVIHGYVAKKKIHKEYARLTGLGSIIGLGSVGSYVFSSGGALILTAIIFLIYALVCIGAPIYTLYGLYGIKGDADARALKLKKMLRVNWLPLILFVVALVFSFFGGEYGFDAASLFTSLGNSYGPGVFLGTLSWGIILSLSASILVAVKGVEI